MNSFIGLFREKMLDQYITHANNKSMGIAKANVQPEIHVWTTAIFYEEDTQNIGIISIYRQ